MLPAHNASLLKSAHSLRAGGACVKQSVLQPVSTRTPGGLFCCCLAQHGASYIVNDLVCCRAACILRSGTTVCLGLSFVCMRQAACACMLHCLPHQMAPLAVRLGHLTLSYDNSCLAYSTAIIFCHIRSRVVTGQVGYTVCLMSGFNSSTFVHGLHESTARQRAMCWRLLVVTSSETLVNTPIHGLCIPRGMWS